MSKQGNLRHKTFTVRAERDKHGKFIDIKNINKSIRADTRTHAKRKVKAGTGHGHLGDIKVKRHTRRR